jgi:hypothetical protein
MLRPIRLLACASAAALILGAAPGVDFAFVAPAHAQADVLYTASAAPPVLPVYSQPPIPGLGYIWIPGYWAWDGTEFYWVPGYWELPPAADLLWTPGYWGWNDVDNDYAYYSGYWAPTVGFYGGVDYGFGYPGEGYYGGYWRNHHFFYNRNVNNLGTAHIATVYSAAVPAPVTPTRVSFNGGRGGATARPTPAQLAILRGPHQAPTAAQIQHRAAASRIASLKYGANHGQPPIAAAQRANEFPGAHVAAGAAAAGAALAAHAAAVHRPPTPAHVAQAGPAVHPGVAAQAAPRIAHAAPRIAHAAPRIAHAAPRIAHAAPRIAHAAPRIAHAAPHYAARAPAFHPHVAYHAPAFHPRVAYHAPAMHFAPHFAAAPHFAVAPHFAAPHFAAPHLAAPHFAGGGMHFGGAPHIGGPGPRRP